MLLAGGLFFTVRPTFIEQLHPRAVVGEARPLPLNPRQPVSTLFSTLGTQAPIAHPTRGNVERYSYGTSLTFDVTEGLIYSLSIGVPNRLWRGIHVGMSQTQIAGGLTLLGTVQQAAGLADEEPAVQAGYLVYPSIDNLPRRRMTAEVRPPNGCYDVLVDLQPQVQGLLSTRRNRYTVVAKEDEAVQWVATQIQVVDRSRAGPLDTRAC